MITITIPLSQKGKYAGKYTAIVDAIDADLAQFDWHVGIFQSMLCYAMRNNPHDRKQITQRMHRVIMERMLGRKLKRSEHIDHIDGDGLNNRRSNLRLATQTQNNHNARIRTDNASGYKGVSWHKSTQKWIAQIQVNGKRKYLGLFDTPEEAHQAYCEAADKYHGKFANYGE